MTRLLPLLVFICGAFYEASCVGFVYNTTQSRPSTAALLSMLAGLATVTGIFNSVRDWHVAPFYVLGLGAGSYGGVWMKRRRERAG